MTIRVLPSTASVPPFPLGGFADLRALQQWLSVLLLSLQDDRTKIGDRVELRVQYGATTDLPTPTGGSNLFYDTTTEELLIDLGAWTPIARASGVLPHYSKGSGNFNVLMHYSLAVNITGAAGSLVKVSAFDVIKSMQGGVAEPSYTFYMRKDPDSYGSGDSDPFAEYVTFDNTEAGTNVVWAKVSDGTTTTAEVALSISVTA